MPAMTRLGQGLTTTQQGVVKTIAYSVGSMQLEMGGVKVNPTITGVVVDILVGFGSSTITSIHKITISGSHKIISETNHTWWPPVTKLKRY
jgi:hypothetical protein